MNELLGAACKEFIHFAILWIVSELNENFLGPTQQAKVNVAELKRLRRALYCAKNLAETKAEGRLELLISFFACPVGGSGQRVLIMLGAVSTAGVLGGLLTRRAMARSAQED